jgi:hypothetical protein
MQQTMVRPRKSGRAYIGPKAQANIPQQQMDWILDEAEARGIPYADMMREVIATGVSVLRGAR